MQVSREQPRVPCELNFILLNLGRKDFKSWEKSTKKIYHFKIKIKIKYLIKLNLNLKLNNNKINFYTLIRVNVSEVRLCFFHHQRNGSFPCKWRWLLLTTDPGTITVNSPIFHSNTFYYFFYLHTTISLPSLYLSFPLYHNLLCLKEYFL